MKIINYRLLRIIYIIFLLGLPFTIYSQFIHPGLNFSKSDLDRMKAKVLEGAHPWIDGWNLMIVEGDAQSTFTPYAKTEIGGTDGTRQRSQRDANAAIWNILRWYVTGNTANAECAVNILNAYSNTIQTSTGQLFMLPIWSMVQAGELLRMYPGWKTADIDKFKNMCLNIFYPACRDFRHQVGSWPGWDGPANLCCLEIAIFCEDTVKFNDAIEYYKNGEGGGCITKAIFPSGQITEMGRDIAHAEIGPNSFTDFCAAAWNQGIDLFSYADNRLLKGYEYFNKFNLNHGADNWETAFPGIQNFYFPAKNLAYRLYGSMIQYELIYNHYVVRKGLTTPYTRAMLGLNGIGILNGSMYTYSDTTTLFAAKPIPAAPTNLIAKPGVSKVELYWTASPGDVARGYNVWRSTVPGGPYSLLSTWSSNTVTLYADNTVTANTTYYYTVSALNNTGTSPKSEEVSATPVNFSPQLKTGWAMMDVNTPTLPSSAIYSPINNNTFSVSSTGNDIWGNDRFGYLCSTATGDCMITARIYDAVQDASMTKAKIGLMMRETNDPNSMNATIHFGGTQTRMAALSYRTTNNGGTSYIIGNQHTWVPSWVRLQRLGNTFTAYQSDDSINWFSVGSINISMANTYKVGLFVCGTGALFNCIFDNITITGGGTVPLVPTSFNATTISSTRVKLTWTASAATSTYILKRSINVNGPYTLVKNDITGTSYEDYGLLPDTTYYYVLKSANIAGESKDSSEVSGKTSSLKLPPAPTSVSATAGNSMVTLTWNATEEQTLSYNIKRSSISNGPYTLIGNSMTVKYIDNTAINDTAYYYTISAVNSLGEGLNSNQVLCKPSLGQYFYWPFDETSGTSASCAWTSLKGTLMTTGATWIAGKYNNGIHLSKSSSAYISLPNAITGTLKDFTICAWIKLDSRDQWSRIFDFGNGTTNYMFLSPVSNTGYVRYAITKGSGEQQINSSSTISTGTWTHVAVTLKDTIGILYINGVEVGRNNSMTLIPFNLGTTTYNYIGKSQWPADPYFNGSIDEFRIYRQALTSQQINQIKNAKNQIITFDSIPSKIINDPDFPLLASSNSGLPIKLVNSNSSVGTIVNSNFHITGIGSTNITASQSGNLDYVAAINVSRPLVVTNMTQSAVINSNTINIYPNPFFDIIKIDNLYGNEKILKVILYNFKGFKIIEDDNIGNLYVLDTKRLNAGIYTLKILLKNKEITRKLIKY